MVDKEKFNKKIRADRSFIICQFLTNVVILGICVVLMIVTNKELAQSDRLAATETIKQVTDDWKVLPFVELETNSDVGCSNGFEPVFTKEWLGTEKGCLGEKCDATKDTGNRGCVTIEVILKEDEMSWRDCRKDIDAIDPILQTQV